jgi:mono/diheme cytochrome c family protein
MRRRTGVLFVPFTFVTSIAFVALGCGSSRYARDGGVVSPMSVRAVDWNPQKIDVGKVSAVVESEGTVVAFGDHGATVLSSGALVGVDRSATSWRTATTIPAADGSGRWIVAVDGDGKLRRLRNGSTLEDVGARYGFANAALIDVADFGNGFVGFLGTAAGGAPFAAIADGKSITRYDAGFRALAGGDGKGAAMESEAIRFFDPSAKQDLVFDLSGVRLVAVDPHGRLYAATEHELYEENARGELSLRYETAGSIHGLTPSGERIWFADGGDLGTIEPNDGVFVTKDLKLGGDAKLAPSASGDVWAVAGGALSRFSRADAAAPAPNVDAVRAQQWTSDVQPVFARRCAACHMPGGASGVDLSTFDAWSAKKALIRKRVVETRSMPPKNSPIDDADRAAIEAWTR